MSGQPHDGPVQWPVAALFYIVADHRTMEENPLILDKPVDRELFAILMGVAKSGVPAAIQIDNDKFEGTRRIVAEPLPGIARFKTKYRRPFAINRALGRARHIRRDLRVRSSPDDEVNSADGKVLKDFLDWGLEQLNPKRYAAFFWGHSAGPAGLFQDMAADGFPEHLTLPELREAMTRSDQRQPQLMVFRDCWTALLETAFELEGVTTHMVCTQSIVPADGPWPYRHLFNALKDHQGGDDAGRRVVRHIGAHLAVKLNRRGFDTVPYSLLALDSLDEIGSLLGELVNEILLAKTTLEGRQALATAFSEARAGEPGETGALVDMSVLCARLSAITEHPGLVETARRVEVALQTLLVKERHPDSTVFRGVSAYYEVPGSERRPDLQVLVANASEAKYKTLRLSVKTRWHQIALKPIT
jgi:hypothetical protein